MPYRRKDRGKSSPFYTITYTDERGERVKEPTRITDYHEAKKLEAERAVACHKAAKGVEILPRTVDQVLLAYLKAAPTILAKSTATRSRDCMRAMLPHLTGRIVDDRLIPVIGEYKAARTAAGVGPGTIAKELHTLSAAIQYCNKEYGWQLTNYAKGRAPKAPPGRLRWLQEHEAEALIAAARRREQAPWLAPTIMLSLATLMRPGECLALTTFQIQRSAGLITFGWDESKKRRPDALPLNATALAALDELDAFRAEHCPSSTYVICNYHGERFAGIRTSWRKALKDAGISDMRRHDLRHTGASWLAQRGESMAHIQQLLRHSSGESTQRYVHLQPEHARGAASALDDILTNQRTEPCTDVSHKSANTKRCSKR